MPIRTVLLVDLGEKVEVCGWCRRLQDLNGCYLMELWSMTGYNGLFFTAWAVVQREE